MMKHSSCQFGDSFSEFGRQSEKFSSIGAVWRKCILMLGCKGLKKVLPENATKRVVYGSKPTFRSGIPCSYNFCVSQEQQFKQLFDMIHRSFFSQPVRCLAPITTMCGKSFNR